MRIPKRKNNVIFYKHGRNLYYFRIVSSNGHPIIVSDYYESKGACKKGLLTLSRMFGSQWSGYGETFSINSFFKINYKWEK